MPHHAVGSSVPGADGYFDDQVATRYDESVADMFEPGAVGAAVGSSPHSPERDGARARHRHRPHRPSARPGVPVHGIDRRERWWRSCTRSRAVPTSRWRSETSRRDRRGPFTVAYLVFNTILNLTTQAERVECPQRRSAPRAGRLLRRRGRRTGASPAPARRDLSSVPRQRVEVGDRRVRRREPGPHVASPRVGRRSARALLGALPLRLALRARPHGADRRDAAA